MEDREQGVPRGNARLTGAAEPSSVFETKRLPAAPDALAPDGSEVRVLCGVARGGMAHFSLPPRAVSRAVAHRTI